MRTILAATSVLLLILPRGVAAIDILDTRLLAQPAVSATEVAFAHANDLWIANRDGSAVRRLTSHPGVESGPHFSPDGSLVAFTGRYEGPGRAHPGHAHEGRGLCRPLPRGDQPALLQARHLHRSGCRPGPLPLRPREEKGRPAPGQPAEPKRPPFPVRVKGTRP